MNNKRVYGKCKNCEKELVGRQKRENVYCNRECQKDFEYEERKKLVDKTGDVNSGFKSNGSRRNYLKKERGIKCEVCGSTDWRGKPIPIVMDHIDGNSDNWKLLNLRLICGNCDMQTPTYKSKNKGNGRHYRRVRYKEGKSY